MGRSCKLGLEGPGRRILDPRPPSRPLWTCLRLLRARRVTPGGVTLLRVLLPLRACMLLRVLLLPVLPMPLLPL